MRLKVMVMQGVLIATLLFAGANLLPTKAEAAAKNDSCHQTASFLGFPTWYEYLEVGTKGADNCAIVGPSDSNGEFQWDKALPRIALAIVDILLRVVGIITVAYVIYGGFRYITSQGEPDATKKAQGTVINALIGMAIAIFAVTIVSFIGNTLWK